MDNKASSSSEPQQPKPKSPEDFTLPEYIETNEKTIQQIVHFINNNLNVRLLRLEGNVLDIKK